MSPTDIQYFLGPLAIGSARTIPMVCSIPVFGGPHLPGQIRVAMGIGLSFLCFPVLTNSAPTGGAVLWGLLLAREVMVGIVMGFVGACMFRAAEAAGYLVDVLRGAALSEALSPMGAGKSSPLGALMTLLAVVVFFEMGGPVHLTAALARSYEAIPVGVPVGFAGRPHAMAMVAIAASAKLIESAIGLCAPVIVALLLADVVLGMVGRAVPQIQLYFVGMPLKALLGVGTFLLGLASMDIALQHGLHGFFDLLGLAFQIRP